MSKHKALIAFVFPFFVGVLCGLITFCAISNEKRPPRPPQLAGQNVPDKFFNIDFTKRYNLWVRSYDAPSYHYENVQLLGFTGKIEAGGFKGGFFDHWLVLQLADGRLAYVPGNSVHAIEEATTK
jgi:hypothetical protein